MSDLPPVSPQYAKRDIGHLQTENKPGDTEKHREQAGVLPGAKQNVGCPVTKRHQDFWFLEYENQITEVWYKMEYYLMIKSDSILTHAVP